MGALPPASREAQLVGRSLPIHPLLIHSPYILSGAMDKISQK